MNRNYNEAYSIGVWEIDKAATAQAANEGRPQVCVNIGRTCVGEESYYISEWFFQDVYEKIKDKSIRCHVNLYAYPQIVCEKNGMLVPHNNAILELKQAVKKTLDSTLECNQIRAFSEIRQNSYESTRIGQNTKNLRDKLTLLLPEHLNEKKEPMNYSFISLILRERSKTSTAPEENELTRQLQEYTKPQLVSLYASMLEYAAAGTKRFEPFKSLIAQYAPEVIEAAYRDEVARRFYIGEIR